MYSNAIKSLLSRLKNNPALEIQTIEYRAALPANVLQEFILRYALPDDIAGFYEVCNGFQVSYTFRSNTYFDKEDFSSYIKDYPEMWPSEDYWNLNGCINLLPLPYLLQTDWQGFSWNDWETEDDMIIFQGAVVSEQQLVKQLKPFDVFSKEAIAALYIEPKGTSVLLSTDHNASYTDYPPIKFTEYIAGIIATEGLIDKRPEIFSK